jgi:hypothetical protein
MSQPSSPPEWLYSRNGKTFGPLTSAQLRQLVVEGRIGPKDLISRTGSDRWSAAGAVKGLFPAATLKSDTVEQVAIHPAESDLPAESIREDSKWRTFASRFLVANIVLCGLVGLIKPPPAHIAAYNEAMDNVRETTSRLRENMDRSLKRIHEDIEENKRQLQRDSSK